MKHMNCPVMTASLVMLQQMWDQDPDTYETSAVLASPMKPKEM